MPMRQKHDEICLELRAEMLNGGVPPGNALPSLEELGRVRGVSVAAVNKFIAKLKAAEIVMESIRRGQLVFSKLRLPPTLIFNSLEK